MIEAVSFPSITPKRDLKSEGLVVFDVEADQAALISVSKGSSVNN